MSGNADLDFLLGAFSKVPGLAARTRALVENGRGLAEDIKRIGERGEGSYEESHWGKRAPNGTWPASVPDPRGGVVELGRLVAVEYLTIKGKRARQPAVWRHVFGPDEREPHEDGFDENALPSLAYTSESPSGLVIVRFGKGFRSEYDVSSRGIEG